MILLLVVTASIIIVLIWLIVAEAVASIRYRYSGLSWHSLGWFAMLADRVLDLFFYGWKGYSVLIGITAFVWLIFWTRKIAPELARQNLTMYDILRFYRR